VFDSVWEWKAEAEVKELLVEKSDEVVFLTQDTADRVRTYMLKFGA
jgi:hypothetical protein